MAKADTALNATTKAVLLRTFGVILTCILFFATMHLVMQNLDFSAENDWLINLFDMDHEGNLPTWFASVLWLSTGITAAICFMVERMKRSRKASYLWLLIALAFICASADEIATIHENVGTLLQSLSSTNPGSVIAAAQHLQAPNSPWIIYYLPGLVVFGAVGCAFLWSRFRQTTLFVVLVFLTMDAFALAIGMDHMQGMPREAQIQLAHHLNMTPGVMLDWSIVIEESLEDLGCTFLILCFGGYAMQTLFDKETNEPVT